MTVGSMVDKFFNHNSIIKLWEYVTDDTSNDTMIAITHPFMAWELTDKNLDDVEEEQKMHSLANKKFKEFFGLVPASIVESDVLNILVEREN